MYNIRLMDITYFADLVLTGFKIVNFYGSFIMSHKKDKTAEADKSS